MRGRLRVGVAGAMVILSAEQSNGLETWLTENGYKIPAGAADVLDGYIKQKMHFFVAKVNLEEKKNAALNTETQRHGGTQRKG